MTDWIPPELLQPAFKAVRKALRDMDADDVPAVLRKIAGQSGRRLPPPLARKLIERLDEDEWLRGKAAEAGSDLDPDSSDPARAVSALFLFRPEDWEERARLAAEQRAAGAGQALVQALQRTVADLERQLANARDKARTAQDRAQAAEAEAERKVQAARRAVEAARREERSAAEGLRRSHEDLLERHDRLSSDLEESGERIAQLREELLRARRAGREPASEGGPQVWGVRDPLEIARLLDEIGEALRPEAPVLAPDESAGERSPFVFPAGISPDRPEAIDWLLACEDPFVLVVDGYNVTFLFDEDGFTEAQARDRLNEGLARFRRMSAAPTRVIVVYDSTHSGGVTASTGRGGIEVRFTEAGHSADEEILEIAAQLDDPAAVVTTDRQVREGAEESGALGVWSQALRAWLERR